MNSDIPEENESALADTPVETATPSDPVETEGETNIEDVALDVDGDEADVDQEINVQDSPTLTPEDEQKSAESGDPVAVADAEEKNLESDTDDIGEIPSSYVPSQERRQSKLTIKNLKIHEEVVAREEQERSLRSSPVKTSSQHSVPRTSSPLAPLKGSQRSGSGQPRLESGQRSTSRGLHHGEDGMASPAPSGESLRTGSGKPLPPIEKVSDRELDLDLAEKQDSFTDDDIGTKTSMPKILGYRRERSKDNDSETVVSTRSAVVESVSRSERSVSFVTNLDRLQGRPSTRNAAASPAGREVMRKKNPDGSEKVAISIATETEWSWLESVKMAGKTRGGSRTSADVVGSSETTPSTSGLPHKKRHRKRASISSTSHLTVTEGGAVDLEGSSSDLEDDTDLREWEEKLEEEEEEEYTDDEDPLPTGTLIPRIGPPRIIQYQRESETVVNQPADPSRRSNHQKLVSTAGIEIPDEEDYAAANAASSGMLAAPKSRKKQRKGSLVSQKGGVKSSESPSRTSSPAEDVAAMLGLNDGGPCEFCNETIKPFPTPEMQETMSPEEINSVTSVSEICEFCQQETMPFPLAEIVEMHEALLLPSELYCCEEYQNLVEFTLNTVEANETVEELIDIAPHAPFGSKQARRAAKERAAARMREREMARQKAAGSNQANFYASHRLEILDGVARQMKTINYALSSQKCMDEGWTVRAATPSDDGADGPDPYEAQPVFQPPIIALRQKSKPGETNVVKKTYENGKSFMVMFEDGTGTVFYPSGNTAIIISSSEKGQYEYLVQDDMTGRPNLLALFEPNGRATCYQNNGQVKLNLTPYRGIYLDQKGAVKKRWLWKDTVTHTHAPPFQPICFAINKSLSLRCMGQDQIFLQFSQEKHSIRFNVGVKLKLVKPENLPKDEVDEHLMYLGDIKAYFKVVTDKIHNQIKFSKSPKLSNMRPPYTVQKHLLRNEKLKTKKVQQQAGKQGQPIVTVN